MTEFLHTAQSRLLEPVGISNPDIERLLGVLNDRRIDYGDLYFQYTSHESWSLEDGAVKSGSRNIDQGVGIRAVSGEKTGFSYSDELTVPVLTEAAASARAIAKGAGQDDTRAIMSEAGSSAPALYQPVNPVESLNDEAKVALLKRVEAAATMEDSEVCTIDRHKAIVADVVLLPISPFDL